MASEATLGTNDTCSGGKVLHISSNDKKWNESLNCC